MANPQASAPKRHHYLPKSYQRAWCDAMGRVAVRRRTSEEPYLTSMENVGVEAHLYGKGTQALWRERNFSLLEDAWPSLRTELVRAGNLNGQDRQMAAMFIALQVARTREHIAGTTFIPELAASTDERPIQRTSVREFIRKRHGYEPSDTEVEAAWSLAVPQLAEDDVPTIDDAFAIAIDNATRRLAPMFQDLHWRVETTDEPVLWTSDRPVMPWRPPSPRDRFEGVGYGNADEIRMPLKSTAMLVLRRTFTPSPKHVPASRFHHYNDDIARQCYEFVLCSPSRPARLKRLALARHRAAVRFHIAPGVEVRADGTEVPMDDVIQTRIPIRDEPDLPGPEGALAVD